MLKTTRGWILVPALLLAASVASAAPIVYRYEARITDVSHGSGVDFAGQADVGDLLTGMIQWDTSTPLSQITTSNFHVYRAQAPIHQWTVDNLGPGGRAGRYPTNYVTWGVTTSFSGIQRGAHAFGGTHLARFEPGPAPFGLPDPSFHANFDLWDLAGTVFESADLPKSLTLGDFDRREMLLVRYDGDAAFQWRISSEIVSLVPIPEPGSGLLVMLGLAGLASRRPCVGRAEASRPPS